MTGLKVERKQKIVDFIRDFSRRNNYPPNLREIGAAIGVKSASLVSYYIDELVAEGVLGRKQKVSRAIWVKEQ